MRYLIVIVSLMLSLSAQAQSLNDLKKQRIEEVIEQYIWNNPEIIWDSLQRYQAYLEKERQKRALVEYYSDDLYQDQNTPVFHEDGTKTIVEFFDYACGFCRVMVKRLMVLFKERDDIRLVLKELPILGENSVLAARAALAVWLQDRQAYWTYHQLLMDYGDRFTPEVLEAFAQYLGIDIPRWRKDRDSAKIQAMIDKNYRLAQALNVTGTPAFVIGHQIVLGSITVQELQALLE